MKTRGVLGLGLTLLLLAPAFCAAEQRATTADGREVILRDDGTWVYAPSAKGAKKGVLQFKNKRATFGIYLPPNTWKQSKEVSNEAADAEFQHVDGDVYAMVISERVEIPLEALRMAALENAKGVDAEAEIVQEERRKVNGLDVLCLTLHVKANGIPITFYGYYYSGEIGAVQIVTWTGRNLFKEMKPKMDVFLNGFDVLKK